MRQQDRLDRLFNLWTYRVCRMRDEEGVQVCLALTSAVGHTNGRCVRYHHMELLSTNAYGRLALRLP